MLLLQEEAAGSHSAALVAVQAQLAEAEAAATAAKSEAEASAADCEQASSLIDTLEQREEALRAQLGERSTAAMCRSPPRKK